jgi:hypothetical protein
MRLAVFIFGAMLCACQGKDNSSLILAEVGGEKLTASEIQTHLPKGLEAKDSALFCSAYTEQWIREQVLKMEAEKLTAPAELELQVERFRQQLLVQSLKEKVIADRIGLHQNTKADTTETGLSEEINLENKKWQIWENFQTELLKAYEAEGKIKKP